MSKEKRSVPKLRFPGFTEDWEQRKLGDIATFSKGNGYSKSDLTPSGDPIILYGRLYTNYETTISNVDTFVGLKDKSVISQGGEVIVPASGETAEDISRASVVKNQGIIIGGDLNVIKVNHLLDPTFLALTISNGGQQKELSKRAQGKSVVHLHNSDLQEVNLTFPLLNEQKEISTLFEKMDNIITLHQRKLEHLNLKKKALLQKLFPKNGERYPELRFPGFTDAWEQRKVNEIFKVTRGQVLAASLTTPEKNRENIYPVYSSQTKDNGLLGYYSEYLFENAITWTTDGANAGTVNFRPGRFYSTNVNGVLINENGYACYAVSEIINKVAYKYVSKVGNPKLMNNVMAEINIMITPDIDELEQISKLIEAYNQYITLHQRKLEHLQLQKKALLQQMFV